MNGIVNSNSALDFLLRHMRSKSDFPALSGIISEINEIVSSESDSHGKLAQAILQDFALTNKLIKLVNTVSFRQFGGNINTISKAVVILGFDTVRNVAMTLILLEFLQNKSQAVELKDEVISSFFAGILASELSSGGLPGEPEEAMICAMFYILGRLLTTFYFFEESRQITRLMEDRKISEDMAAIEVLGVSYNQLGMGVAESWHFPHRLLSGMKKLPAGKLKKPRSDVDLLNVKVNLANELCMISAITDVKEKNTELKKLCERYESAMVVSEKTLSTALESSLSELSLRSVILGIVMHTSPLLNRIQKWSGNTEPESSKASELDGITILDTVTSGAASQAVERYDAEMVLSAGINDVTNTLVEDYNLNDVLRMVLETIYRSLGFKHALIFIRDNKQNAMLARLGFGEHIDAFLPRLKFSLPFVPDVFHLAVEKGLDLVIEDVQSATISDKIPSWFRDSITSQSFILLPVRVNKKAVALIYADMQEANSLKISERQLSLLRTLRNQAVLAIKSKLL